ncbi:MAG: site-specific integrase [Actinomycetota bacterium]|nr:site-specific integrase [Actinomycetota bacterium]
MIEPEDATRDLSKLVVAQRGALRSSGDPFEPFQLLDATGGVVEGISVYLRELQACGRPASTQRSYAMDLLRFFRFLWALGVPWSEATHAEARDFCTWMQLVDKPMPLRGRHGEPPWAPGSSRDRSRRGAANALTGKPSPATKYAPATVAHAETVLRSFYELHLEAGTGPMVNPFPLSRARRGGRAHAHHNPMERWRPERTGRYRPKVPQRSPRQIPDEHFDALFAGLSSHRDRALVALFCSSGARAAELLGACCGDVDPGAQLVTVIRKGSRALQQLPASPDAFVWLRLYQAQMEGLVSMTADEPLFWTLRRPFRRLNYHAARAMFTRANAKLGANWTLHDLRHTAAYRMARDPQMPLTDVQWVLGHAHLETTQLYVRPSADDVIASVRAHHARRGDQVPTPDASGYRAESLAVLFKRPRR